MKCRRNLFFFLSLGALLGWLAASLVQASSRPGDLPQLLLEANQSYNQRDFVAARSRYELLTSYVHNGSLYYNLGNTYLNLGEIGKAIRSYRNALLYMPRDEDLKANLAHARSLTKDQIEKSGEFPLVSTLCFWYGLFSVHELFLALIVGNAILWTVAALRLWFRNEVLYWTFMSSLAFIIVVGGTWGITAYRTFVVQEGVVTTSELAVRSGNDLRSTVLFYLHDGAEIRIVDRQNNWVKIALPDGKKGWAQQYFIGIVGEGSIREATEDKS